MVVVVQRTFAILSLTPQSLLFESLLKHTSLDRRRLLRLAAGWPQRSRRHRTPRSSCRRRKKWASERAKQSNSSK